MKYFKPLLVFLGFLTSPFGSMAQPKVSDEAPLFTTKTHAGDEFSLSSRKGGWTVLFFYPKADTPGCTKQACAFRDNIEKIRALGAEVYGISADSVQSQKAFHDKHQLKFTLLADPKSEIIRAYGTKMPGLKMSKRWTFILDPQLKIAAIEKNVDPLMDAVQVAEIIQKLSSDER